MATLGTLPSETSLQIANFIPDRQSLGSLIHASPQYYQFYCAFREEVFSALASRELSARGLDIQDVLVSLNSR